MNTLSLRSVAILFLLAIGLWASGAQAQCTAASFYADLRTGTVVNDDTALFHVSPLAGSQHTGCTGWLEAVVKVDIPKDCTAATVAAEYEGTPVAWTLNIGDSPTNNGYAGDAGTTDHNAELWVVNENLALANAGNSPSAIDNPLVFKNLSLTDGALKFLVRDQFVSWGQPYEFVQSPSNKLLFAIPDDSVKPAEERSIYVGLNRVISGAPGNGRTGCGLRSALIRFQ